MRYFSYFISFLLHPIWLPIYGAMLVLFQISFSPSIEQVKFMWLLLLLVTIAIPTLIYLLLFVLNWLKDPITVPIEKQKFLLYGYIAMLLLVAFKIVSLAHSPILHVHIMTIIMSCFLVLLLHFLKFKGNIFSMGAGALTVFTILLSLSFEIDMTYLIAFFLFLSGAGLSSQVYLTGEPLWKVSVSWVVGALPQLSLILLFKNLLFGGH